MTQKFDLTLDFIKELLILGAFFHQNHDAASHGAHGRADVFPTRRVHVRDVFLFADRWQVAHYLYRWYVAGENYDPAKTETLR